MRCAGAFAGVAATWRLAPEAPAPAVPTVPASIDPARAITGTMRSSMRFPIIDPPFCRHKAGSPFLAIPMVTGGAPRPLQARYKGVIVGVADGSSAAAGRDRWGGRRAEGRGTRPLPG